MIQYAIRENKNIKEVKCKNNHKFCFNCLRDWHGNTNYDLELIRKRVSNMEKR